MNLLLSHGQGNFSIKLYSLEPTEWDKGRRYNADALLLIPETGERLRLRGYGYDGRSALDALLTAINGFIKGIVVFCPDHDLIDACYAMCNCIYGLQAEHWPVELGWAQKLVEA